MSGKYQPTVEQLLSVIKTQTAIVKLGLDLNSVMTVVAQQAKTIIEADGAIIELLEADEMVVHSVSDSNLSLLGHRIKIKNSLSGRCIEEKEILYSQNTEIDPRVDVIACRYVGLRSMAVVPLIHCDEPLGVLKIYSHKVKAFATGDLQLLELMSELIAAAMYHATRFGTQELYRMATQDGLTELSNRSQFLDHFRRCLASAQSTQNYFALLMIDMDGLKPINDQYGHRVGDAALKEFAQRLKMVIRTQDHIARIGGDEFAIILTQLADPEQSLTVVDRINDTCELDFIFENKNLSIRASTGIAIYPTHATTVEELLEYADQQMYLSKRSKK
ncbi:MULTISPECIES: sensor domain-containing diguanylate cyclase [unclassified Acinetobacter]|uniref:sensor domain-containing diguanylate cyclase n=1 Tax=unclassified Acinetobacter TaxID=196816 RepID=UPI00190DA32E|nr:MULTISPECIES: sensor domain-containing diguanylate cyclase [unclassified Acinetobacter]MBK0063043.1 GGDEF domain-containing protein [Acinetobacter sp. S55]MBK0066539.1 GGDEF domain-containing protein [Acinetobacter sp. S54]